MEASGQLQSAAALSSEEEPPVHVLLEAGWVPAPVVTWWQRKELQILP
jgi:hypothetical protein